MRGLNLSYISNGTKVALYLVCIFVFHSQEALRYSLHEILPSKAKAWMFHKARCVPQTSPFLFSSAILHNYKFTMSNNI